MFQCKKTLSVNTGHFCEKNDPEERDRKIDRKGAVRKNEKFRQCVSNGIAQSKKTRRTKRSESRGLENTVGWSI